MCAMATALFGCRTQSMPINLRSINAEPAAQVGAGGGFAAALFVIGKAAQRLRDEDSREARSNMVWSIVGSLLMMPLSGVMLAAIIYMVMK